MNTARYLVIDRRAAGEAWQELLDAIEEIEENDSAWSIRWSMNDAAFDLGVKLGILTPVTIGGES